MVDTAGTLAPLNRAEARSKAAAAPGIRVEALSPEWLSRYAAFAARFSHGAAQKPVWVRAWGEHACLDMLGVTVEGRGGAAWMMLPLEVARSGRFTVVRFIGGRHANSNFPTFDGSVEAPAASNLRAELVGALRKARPDIDLIHLERMAPDSEGVANPLLPLGSTPSPNLSLSFSLEGGMDRVLGRAADRRKAKKQRASRRRFEEAGGFRRFDAKTAEEVDAVLAQFFELKAARFRKAGIFDVFAAPETRAALRSLFVRSLGEPEPPFALHGLEVGGVLRAVTANSHNGRTVGCEFSAIREDELSKHSPGEFLFHEDVREDCLRGFRTYDFGVGDEPYKRTWGCDEVVHQDLSLPVSTKGRLFHLGLGCLARVKTAVKRNPAIWNLVKKLRRQAAGTDAPAPEAEAA